MAYSKEVLTKFAKLNIDNFLELALLLPYSYEDYTLYNSLQEGKTQVIDAVVESVTQFPNSIQIEFYVHNFSLSIHAVLFRPKPYMMHQFALGVRAYYYGNIEKRNGVYTMAMPKKITQIGSITPKYKTQMRSDYMWKFIQKHLLEKNLIEEGLSESVIRELLSLHNPTRLIDVKNLDVKALYALKYVEIYNYMKTLSKKRRYFEAMRSVNSEYKIWLETLPFTLTKEQLNAIEDIQKDLSKNVAAKRIVVGDVGSGKTMVILASAYMNRNNRTILMAPTTILARQLYEEAQKFLPSMSMVLITNKSKEKDFSSYSFLIGTHALLYKELPVATLVMVDEQHRFGTKQRNDLEKLVMSGTKKPHYIQFSATPIPRTQAMIETAFVDVTLITTTPFVKDISSQVIRKKYFTKLLGKIKEEIMKKNQVLLVYPLVQESEVLEYQSIEEARGYWEKNFSNVYVTHGKDKHKELVLEEFREKGDILIATTVVEVGISLPRLSLVVIVGAERLGLSTLHQLRGRVSRTGLKGYCYLYTNRDTSSRLDAFIQTKNGFDIANLDLKFRKSGDVLKGIKQSGSTLKWIDLAEDVEIVEEAKKNLEINSKT